MLGHFINNLDPTDEDRGLTRKLGEVNWAYVATETPAGVAGCILQAVRWTTYQREMQHSRNSGHRLRWHHAVGHRYDNLVDRFGVPRIANAIRSRIFANQVRRKLTQPQPEYANT